MGGSELLVHYFRVRATMSNVGRNHLALATRNEKCLDKLRQVWGEESDHVLQTALVSIRCLSGQNTLRGGGEHLIDKE